MIYEVVHNMDSTIRKSHEDFLPIKLWGAEDSIEIFCSKVAGEPGFIKW